MSKKLKSEEDSLRERLAQAAALGKLERMSDLIDRGAPVGGHGVAGGSKPWSGYTPLMVACYCGEVQAARVLLAAGACAEERGAQGDAPLTVAAARGRTACVEVLLDAGAEPEGADRQGRSALRMACESGRADIAALLLAAGADPGARDVVGNAPAMAAVAAGSRACLDLLAIRGVNFDTAGRGNTSLLDFSRSAPEWTEMAEWLKAIELARRERAALSGEAGGSALGDETGSGRL